MKVLGAKENEHKGKKQCEQVGGARHICALDPDLLFRSYGTTRVAM